MCLCQTCLRMAHWTSDNLSREWVLLVSGEFVLWQALWIPLEFCLCGRKEGKPYSKADSAYPLFLKQLANTCAMGNPVHSPSGMRQDALG